MIHNMFGNLEDYNDDYQFCIRHKMINNRSYFFTPLYYIIVCSQCKSLNSIALKSKYFTCRGCSNDIHINNKNTRFKIVSIKNKYDDFSSILDKFIIDSIGQKIEEQCNLYHNEIKKIETKNYILCFKKNPKDFEKIKNLIFFKEIQEFIVNSELMNLILTSKIDSEKIGGDENIEDIVERVMLMCFYNYWILLKQFLQINVCKSGFEEIEEILQIKNDKNNDLSFEQYAENSRLSIEAIEEKYPEEIFENKENAKTVSLSMIDYYNFQNFQEIEEYREDINFCMNYPTDIPKIEDADEDQQNELLPSATILNEKEVNHNQLLILSEPNSISHTLKEKIIEQLKENDTVYVSIVEEARRKFVNSQNKVKAFYEECKADISDEEFQNTINEDERHMNRGLPIYLFKSEIIRSITNNKITIVVSETGSGKTTQIVQYCLSLFNLKTKFNSGSTPILCSQPRKISSITVAERLCHETGFTQDKDIKAIYVDNSYDVMEEIKSAKIVFINESILLNRLIADPQLTGVNILILDEAHERSLNLDIILYFLKNYTLNRNDFRLIITSATMNSTQVVEYFNRFNPEVIECNQNESNKNYTVVYSDIQINPSNFYLLTLNFLKDLIEKIFNYNQNYTYDAVIHSTLRAQTVLVFLPELKSISMIRDALESYFEDLVSKKLLNFFELFGSLTYEEQEKIINFERDASVKIILSTNVAETSITIRNCNIVVDCGLHKTRKYNSENKILEDNLELISKDSANQRAGRCGRTEQGTCYRLYTESQYLNMKNFRTAEILRVNISHMILKLTYFGIDNVKDVEFIEHPHLSDIFNSLSELNNLQAIRQTSEDTVNRYSITDFGRWLYKIQIEPLYGRILYDILHKHKTGLHEVVVILSSLCAGDFLVFNSKNFRSIYTEQPFFIEIDKPEEIQLDYSATNNYVNNLTAKIISETIIDSTSIDDGNDDKQSNEIEITSNKYIVSQKYLENVYFLSGFLKIYSKLNPFLNKSVYFLENPICSLGDLMTNLFFIRQYKMIRCLNHYDNLFDECRGDKHYTVSKCVDCNYLKNAYSNCFSLNKKFLTMAGQIEDNLRLTLRINGDFCSHYKGLSEECEQSEYLLSYCTSIYVKLFSSFFVHKEDPFVILKQLEKIDFKKIYEIIYNSYKDFYTKIIGHCFLRVYSYNMAIRPLIRSNQKEGEAVDKDFNFNSISNLYIMVNTEENCKLIKSSTYHQFFSHLKWKDSNHAQHGSHSRHILSTNDYDIFIFSLQSISMNELNLKNVNPIFPEMAKSIPKAILYEIRSLYSKKTFHTFYFDKIGPQLQNFLLEKRKSLKNLGSDHLYESNPLSRLLPDSNSYVNDSKVWFISNKKYFNTDKDFIENLIKTEKENLEKHNVEEFGYLNRDCLVLKIKNGLNIVNVDYNKDQIHFQIILLKQDMSIKELENLLKQKQFMFNKIYTYKKKIYISFRNSQQASNFNKNVKFDNELYSILIIKVIDEDFGHKADGLDNQEILSLIAPINAKEETILKKIESFGKIEDIVIRSWENHKLVYFTMTRISDIRRITERYKAHSDYDGNWSEIKKLNRNLIIAVNFKSLSDIFWDEFSLFCKDNGIVYNKIGKFKILLEQSSDFNIRKVLSFISEDVINLTEFAVSEIKFNKPQTFFKKNGKDFKEFVKAFNVNIDVFPYFKKLHIYGTPTSRRVVSSIINDYLDDLNSEYELKLIDLNSLQYDVASQSNFSKKILKFVHNTRSNYLKDGNNYIKINYSIPKKVVEIEARRPIMQKIQNELNSYIEEELTNMRFNDKYIYNQMMPMPESNIQAVNPREYANQINCEICLDSISEKNILRLGLCGDVFCRECLRDQIIASINSQPYAELPIKCLKCAGIILNSDILSLFKQKEIKYIFYQLTKYFMSLPQGRLYSWCENPNCQFIYKKSHLTQTNRMIRECPNCNMTLCILCGTELIGNLHDDQCKALILKRLSSFDRSWMIKNTTNCPKCNQLYEKSQGCNHMICSKCRPEIHFCYICGKILDSDNPLSHFNDPVAYPHCYNNLHNDVKQINVVDQNIELNKEKDRIEEKSNEENKHEADVNDDERYNLKMILVNDDPNATKRMLEDYKDYFLENDMNEEIVEGIINVRKSSEEVDIMKEDVLNPYAEYSYEKYDEKDNEGDDSRLDLGFYEIDDDEVKLEIEKDSKDTNKIASNENADEVEISYNNCFYEQEENKKTNRSNDNKDSDDFSEYFAN